MTPEFLRGFYDGFHPLRRNCAGHNNPPYENGYGKGAGVRGMLNQLPPLRIELAQRQEDILDLRRKLGAYQVDLDIARGERDTLKYAIEAMRTAGDSEEFQLAFDHAKSLL